MAYDAEEKLMKLEILKEDYIQKRSEWRNKRKKRCIVCEKPLDGLICGNCGFAIGNPLFEIKNEPPIKNEPNPIDEVGEIPQWVGAAIALFIPVIFYIIVGIIYQILLL